LIGLALFLIWDLVPLLLAHILCSICKFIVFQLRLFRLARFFARWQLSL
jgi:hypothetical protein